MENARSRCASVLGVSPEKLYFTSGGTESNALVIHSLLRSRGALSGYWRNSDSSGDTRKLKSLLLYSGIEHPSIRENCLVLEKFGFPIGIIGVEKDGRVSEGTLFQTLEKYPEARFAAIMGVNNETGSLMDIKTLASLLRINQKKTKLPIHFHCDLVQALGKVPIDLKSWDPDSASFSAHKLGGPRGIGLLYLKKPISPLYSGGEQEGGVRPGTENTPGALALADLLEHRAKADTVKAEEEKARERFEYLIGKLKKIDRCSLIPKDREERDPRFSPWILQARFKGLPGAVMVRALDDEGVAVSTGSACSSSSPERPVLTAMGADESERLEGIRISQGWTTDFTDMDTFISAVEKVLSLL